jgi:phosphate transport system protein
MPYLQSISKEVKEMWSLVLSQHQKSLTALSDFDKDLAREIILIEERVNSSEQFIESDCENYFSLENTGPGAVSFVMYILKITRRLEIMGDLAKKIANEILKTNSRFNNQLLTTINIMELFKKSNQVLELSSDAFNQNDHSVAQLTQARIHVFRDMASETNYLLVRHLDENPQDLDEALNLFSIIETLKRVADLAHSICESILHNDTAEITA